MIWGVGPLGVPAYDAGPHSCVGPFYLMYFSSEESTKVLANSNDDMAKLQDRCKELERKIADAPAERERELKKAEGAMKKASALAEKSGQAAEAKREVLERGNFLAFVSVNLVAWLFRSRKLPAAAFMRFAFFKIVDVLKAGCCCTPRAASEMQFLYLNGARWTTGTEHGEARNRGTETRGGRVQRTGDESGVFDRRGGESVWRVKKESGADRGKTTVSVKAFSRLRAFLEEQRTPPCTSSNLKICVTWYLRPHALGADIPVHVNDLFPAVATEFHTAPAVSGLFCNPHPREVEILAFLWN